MSKLIQNNTTPVSAIKITQQPHIENLIIISNNYLEDLVIKILPKEKPYYRQGERW